MKFSTVFISSAIVLASIQASFAAPAPAPTVQKRCLLNIFCSPTVVTTKTHQESFHNESSANGKPQAQGGQTQTVDQTQANGNSNQRVAQQQTSNQGVSPQQNSNQNVSQQQQTSNQRVSQQQASNKKVSQQKTVTEHHTNTEQTSHQGRGVTTPVSSMIAGIPVLGQLLGPITSMLDNIMEGMSPKTLLSNVPADKVEKILQAKTMIGNAVNQSLGLMPSLPIAQISAAKDGVQSVSSTAPVIGEVLSPLLGMMTAAESHAGKSTDSLPVDPKALTSMLQFKTILQNEVNSSSDNSTESSQDFTPSSDSAAPSTASASDASAPSASDASAASASDASATSVSDASAPTASASTSASVADASASPAAAATTTPTPA